MCWNILDLCTKNKLARQKFIEHVATLRDDNPNKTFSDLYEDDQMEICHYLLNALDDNVEWLINHDNLSDLIHLIAKASKNQCREDKENLSEFALTLAPKYWRNLLDAYFEIHAKDSECDHFIFATQDYATNYKTGIKA